MFDTILISLIFVTGGSLIAFLIYVIFIGLGAAKRDYVIDEHGQWYRWDFRRGPLPRRLEVDADEAATLEPVDY